MVIIEFECLLFELCCNSEVHLVEAAQIDLRIDLEQLLSTFIGIIDGILVDLNELLGFPDVFKPPLVESYVFHRLPDYRGREPLMLHFPLRGSPPV